jgi:hypothetical protein
MKKMIQMLDHHKHIKRHQKERTSSIPKITEEINKIKMLIKY